MKVLVCGLGSMGKRRIRIVREKYPDFEVFGVDTRATRQAELKEAGIVTYDSFVRAFEDVRPDAVFACSPPLTHTEVILYALENGAHTFSEINLNSKGYDKIIQAASSNNCTAFLSSSFLYNQEIQWIVDKVVKTGTMAYRYHTGQYLPDWHPWEDFREFFVSDRQTNAVREIMAIEFPWIVKAFGPIVDHRCMASKVSKLDLDYPDIVHLSFRHENGSTGSLSFDCTCIKPVRNLEVYNEDLYICWEGKPGTLKQYFQKQKQTEKVVVYDEVENNSDYARFVVENPYMEEVDTFFNIINKSGKQSLWGYAQDQEIIDLIDRIEKEYG